MHKIHIAQVAALAVCAKAAPAPYPQYYSSSSSRDLETSAQTNSFSAAPGEAQVECRKQETAPGKFKFVCDGVRQELVTLRSEHILWLTADSTGPKVVDIEVPNYKIDELIKAGYKTAPGGDTTINVFLKKPEQSAEAEVDVPKGSDGDTVVNLQYEQPTSEIVHFPNDKQYTPLRGPILPPLNAGRFQRGVRVPKTTQ